MRKLAVFNNVSLDGYIADADGDMSWAHSDDPEWNQFAAENARKSSVLVFGRTTYDLMVRFWPTPAAAQAAPVLAERMNNLQKVVFSRKLEHASWNNTIVVDGDIVSEMRKMKAQPGDDMVILGSASIVSQFATAGLIDEYQIVINPIVLGGGKTMFQGVSCRPELRLADSRTFKNGNVFLRYEKAN